MKLFLSLLTLLIITKECDNPKKQNLNDTSDTNMKTEQVEDFTITYTIQSRGMFEEYTASPKELLHKTSRDVSKTFNMSSSDWQTLQKMVSGIDISKLPDLKAPTDKRLYDGAAMASVKLQKDGREIESATFDHGHPPEAIAELVNKVLSLAKSVSKD